MANFERRATAVVEADDFLVLVSTRAVLVAVANTLAAAEIWSNKRETLEVLISWAEQIVGALAGNDLVLDFLYGWHHYFERGDYCFVVGSNSYYS